MTGGVDTWAIPRHSAVGAGLIDRADFECAHRAPLAHPDIGVDAIFRAIFAHRPAWLVAALILRSRAGALLGHEVSTDAEIRGTAPPSRIAPGERIGGWPIQFVSAEELVAGRDNPHLDFRVSVLKAADHRSAIVSTVCWAKTHPGRAYLMAVAPVHRSGVKKLIETAVKHGRL